MTEQEHNSVPFLELNLLKTSDSVIHNWVQWNPLDFYTKHIKASKSSLILELKSSQACYICQSLGANNNIISAIIITGGNLHEWSY